MLAYQHQRIGAALNHRLGVLCRPPPDIVVGQINIVAPVLADFGIVEQYAAIAHRVADGIDAEIEQFIDGFDILFNAHRRLVEIYARMAPVRIKHHLVGFAHNYLPLQRRWLVKLWAIVVARGENTAQQAAWSRSADNTLDPKSDFAENLISGYHLKKGTTHATRLLQIIHDLGPKPQRLSRTGKDLQRDGRHRLRNRA